jgi:uncharacterized membrane protein YecN with MAPEG domain
LKTTLLYGGLNALLVTLLGINVSLVRLRDKIRVGAELPKPLLRKVRAHGNAAEWVPLGIVLLLVLEISGAGPKWLHLFGGAFLFSRLLHAFGFLSGIRTSVWGATLNYVTLSGMSGYAVWLHFFG